MSPKSALIGALVVAVALLAIFAIRASGDDTDDTSSSTAAVPASSDRTDIEEDSPLEAVLGFEIEPSWDTKMAAAEAVAGCMREKGFTYEAWVPPDGDALEELFLGNGDLEAVAKWGFGASTLLYPSSETGGAATGYPSAGPAELIDPNEVEMARLSSEEQVNYVDALLEAPDGCAFDGAEQKQQDTLRTIAQRLGPELLALEVAKAAAPELAAFEQAISECLSEAGYLWTTRDQARERFLVLGARLGQDGLSADDLTALKEIQDQETALASAEFECGGTRAARDDVEHEALVRLEGEFVASHGDLLKELLDS